jgi:hypothetical protein
VGRSEAPPSSHERPARYRGAGPAGPFVPPNPIAGWIPLDEHRNAEDAAWLSTLEDEPAGPCEWVTVATATDLQLNTNQRHDKLARIVHKPGDIVRVLFGYRGNGHYAPDGTEGLYIVKSRIGRPDGLDGSSGNGSDYCLIRYGTGWIDRNAELRALTDEQRQRIATELPWDLISHAGRLVRHYWPVAEGR